MNSPQAKLDAYREEVRAFLAENLPPLTAERTKAGYYLKKHEIFDWQRALERKGWSVRNWPVEEGGTARVAHSRDNLQSIAASGASCWNARQQKQMADA